MKKLVLFYSLLLILFSSTLRTQTIDVKLSGRISGEFTMPADNFFYPSDWGGAYLYVDDFISSPSDTTITINLRLKNNDLNDSLNIFFGLNEYSNSLIDSNNFTIIYDTTSFLTFLYNFVDLPDPYIDGIRIYSTINNSVSINLVELRLTNQHFNFGAQEFLLFCLDSNIPRGNVAWIPLQVGNIWEYNEYIPEEGIYSDFQYKIIDSLEKESKNSYVIEKWRLNNMVWNKIAIDTIKTDSNNNIIDQNNEFYFYPYNYLWGSDRAEYSDLLGKLVYVTEFYDNLPGLEVDGIAVADVGILNYYHSNTGFPPTYHISLNGAKVNGTIVYGNITDIVENLIIQPKEFLLQQNYPNPFNPSTKISWQSPVSGWQRITVYDVLGNKVATLVDEYRNAGNYEVEFNASNLPSGVYFYQLQAGDYLETKKMILLK